MTIPFLRHEDLLAEGVAPPGERFDLELLHARLWRSQANFSGDIGYSVHPVRVAAWLALELQRADSKFKHYLRFVQNYPPLDPCKAPSLRNRAHLSS